jgi:aspartyl-tRNA synthetase
LVLNGYEIAGGSIRETDINILQAVFQLLGNSNEEFHKQFGHYIEMFKYGVP